MSLLNVFDIAGSGMSAQSIRLNVTASNLANADSVSSSEGKTYKSRQPVFAAEMLSARDSMSNSGESIGVRVKGIIESQQPLSAEYSPGHPQANKEGYIYRTNVNTMEEMANMMGSSKNYQLNVDVMETAKKLMEKTLTIGQG